VTEPPAGRPYALALSEAELTRYRMMAEQARSAEADPWRRAGIVPGARVADVGCGPGALLPALAAAVGSRRRGDRGGRRPRRRRRGAGVHGRLRGSDRAGGPGGPDRVAARLVRRGDAPPRARPQRRAGGGDPRPPGHPASAGRLPLRRGRGRDRDAGGARRRRPGRPAAALPGVPGRARQRPAGRAAAGRPAAGRRPGGRRVPGRLPDQVGPAGHAAAAVGRPRRDGPGGHGGGGRRALARAFERVDAAAVRPALFAPFFVAIGRRPA
jgi:hypothetical protein